MKKPLIIIILLPIFFGSCKQLILKSQGITKPKTETPESVLEFVDKWKEEPITVYLFKDSTAYKKFMRTPVYKKNLPGTVFFNEKGMLNHLIDSTKCQWSGGYYTSKLKSDTSYQVDTNYRYQEILSSLTPLKKGEYKENFDFTVIVTWAVFLGKYNERQFIVSKAARENKNARIRVILLNIDTQKSWNLQKDKTLKFS